MQNQLKIAAIQSEISWENPSNNLQNYDQLLSTVSKDVDLIVLPEMFTTGFTMNPAKCAESMQGESLKWMEAKAKELNSAVMGSLVIQEKENYFNRAVFVYPNGSIRYYDKRHLFTLAGEDEKYTSGTERLILEYKGWRICPLICYDLRFPVWSRNTNNYDVLVYMANWPKPRINAWDALLKARSTENMCFTIGVNRVGLDENKYEYIGHTQTIDSLGNVIANATENSECIVETVFNKDELIESRNKFQFLNDQDSFEVF